MIIPFTPEMGQKVYLQPLGNAVRGWDGKPITAYVTAVKRKYFYISRVQDGIRNAEIRIEIATAHYYDHNWNTGYNAFPSEEAFRNHMVNEKKRTALMCNTHWMRRASDDAILQIYEILEKAGIAPKVEVVL